MRQNVSKKDKETQLIMIFVKKNSYYVPLFQNHVFLHFVLTIVLCQAMTK